MLVYDLVKSAVVDCPHDITVAYVMALYEDSLLDIQLDLRLPSEDTNELAVELALSEKISAYDAQYIALAEASESSGHI